MIIAAICFLFYELWKLFHPKEMLNVVSSVRFALGSDAEGQSGSDKLEHDTKRIIIVDIAYFIWIIIALIWFPEWRLVAVIVLAISFVKAFLPTSTKLIIIDSVLTSIVLAIAIYYLGLSHG